MRYRVPNGSPTASGPSAGPRALGGPVVAPLPVSINPVGESAAETKLDGNGVLHVGHAVVGGGVSVPHLAQSMEPGRRIYAEHSDYAPKWVLNDLQNCDRCHSCAPTAQSAISETLLPIPDVVKRGASPPTSPLMITRSSNCRLVGADQGQGSAEGQSGHPPSIRRRAGPSDL